MPRWIVGLLVLGVLSPSSWGIAYAASPGTNGDIFIDGGAGGSDAGSSSSDLFVIAKDGSDVRRLTDDGGSHASAVSPDGKRLVFSCRGLVPRRTEVCVMNVDGSHRRRLTRNRTWDGEASWSPNGRRTLFSGAAEGTNRFELFTMSPRGGRLRRVTHNNINEGYPAWKPVGDRIAYVRLDYSKSSLQSDIFTIDLDGTSRRRITRTAAGESGIDWHPEGKRLVFERNGHVVVKIVGAAGVRRITRGANDFAPVWSPRGTTIVFERSGSKRHSGGLIKVHPRSRSKRLILEAPLTDSGDCPERVCFYSDPSWQAFPAFSEPVTA